MLSVCWAVPAVVLEDARVAVHARAGGAGGERGQGLARLVQEACKKAGDVFECAYYGPGEGAHADDPRVVLRRRTVPRAEALQSMCVPPV